MSQVHPRARTTPLTRAEIRASSAPVTALAERYDITVSAAGKWKLREDLRRPACNCDPRAGARWSARAYSPRCVRIFSITGRSRIAAMMFIEPLQFGQCSKAYPGG